MKLMSFAFFLESLIVAPIPAKRLNISGLIFGLCAEFLDGYGFQL